MIDKFTIAKLNNYSIRLFHSFAASFRITSGMDRNGLCEWSNLGESCAKVRNTKTKQKKRILSGVCKQWRCHLLWNEMKDTKIKIFDEADDWRRITTCTVSNNLFNNGKEIIDLNCPDQVGAHCHIIIHPFFPSIQKSEDFVLNLNGKHEEIRT